MQHVLMQILLHDSAVFKKKKPVDLKFRTLLVVVEMTAR